MQTSVPLRVAIVDHHPISRCAYCALLRSEGVDVVADLALSDGAAHAIEALAPDLVIVDVTADAEEVQTLLDRIRPLQCAIVLTSSGARPADHGGFAFVPKADICRAAILEIEPRMSRRRRLRD